jgi:hypothetical protein
VFSVGLMGEIEALAQWAVDNYCTVADGLDKSKPR